MKTEIVRDVWEFYRDNCASFKEPLRKEMRKLDEYVASVEAENAKLRGELDFYKSQVEGVEEERIRLRERWKEAMAENAKLRDAMYTNAGKHALQHMDEDDLAAMAMEYRR